MKTTTDTRAAERAAIDFLSRHTEYAPEYLDLSGRKTRIGPRRGQSANGSPCYWARTLDNGQIAVTFSTFAHGGTVESFVTQQERQERRTGNHSHTRTTTPPKAAPRPAQAADSEELRKLRGYADAIAQWAGAADTGDSEYLKSKGVAEYAGRISGLRFGADGAALVPLLDTDGDGHAVQFLRPGNKLIYGAVTGHFATIGAALDTAQIIHICEGVATGLSVSAALGAGACVLAAISASNIGPVAAAIRKAYKNRIMIIVGDNDKWDKETGLPREFNPGLEAAHAVALGHKFATVAAPYGLPAGMTDFNDLHMLCGLDAVAEQLKGQRRADPAIAFAGKIRKTNAPRPGAINCRYLPKLDIQPGVNLVKSPKGTGKTHALKELSEKSDSLLYLSHLQSLSGDAASRLNLHLYLDVVPGEMNLYPHLSVCLNSVYKLSNNENHQTPHYQYLVIDEVEQVLQRLVTGIDNKELVLETLSYLIRTADHVILLDADLGKTTIDFIKSVAHDRPVHWTLNQYKAGQGRNIVIHGDDAGTILEHAATTLQGGEKVFLTCNSKTRARGVYEFLAASEPGKKGLFISGDNGGDAEARAFFADVNGEAARYDFIVTTPAANTGISIDADSDGNPAFQFVGGIFKNGINRPQDALQALGRVRGTKAVHIHIERRLGAYPRTQEAITAAWLVAGKEAQSLGIFPAIGDDGRRVPTNSIYSRLCLSVVQAREHGQYRFFENMLEQAAIEGYSFSWLGDYLGTAKDTSKEAREIEKAEYFTRITSAADIDETEAAQLDSKNRKTMAETDALTKYELQQFYPGLDIGAAMEFDKRGQGRGQVLRLENTLADDAAIFEKHKKQALDLEADKRAHDTARTFGRLLLGAVGINSQLDSRGHTYSADSAEITGFIDSVIRHRAVFQAVARIPTDKQLRGNPLKFVGEQLRRHGIGQERTGRNGSGKYCINAGRLELLADIVKTRIGDTPCVYINKIPGVSHEVTA